MKCPDIDILTLAGAVAPCADTASTARHLLEVLNPPIDYPLLAPVLHVASNSIVACGRTLSCPTPLFAEIVIRVAESHIPCM